MRFMVEKRIHALTLEGEQAETMLKAIHKAPNYTISLHETEDGKLEIYLENEFLE